MKTRITFVLALGATIGANGQGCSDAGVCSAGPIGQLPLWQDSTADVVDYRHYTKVMYSYAVGEQGVIIQQVQPELNLGITERWSAQVKVPYVSAQGNLGENSGIGDMILSTSYAFRQKENQDLTALAGLRIPTGSAGPSSINQVVFGPEASSLPMPYQTGLGTLDLLLGLQYRQQRWTWAVAYQHVLSQHSQSAFLHSSWNGDRDALGYFESFDLERADDLVARIQYAYGCGRLALQPGLLAIYHVALDSRLEKVSGPMDMGMSMFERMEVQGSDGLTLNITADLRYKLAERWAVEALFGTPVITREVRPDGLTRSLVTGFSLRYRF